MKYFSAGVRRGYGSILRIVVREAQPPYLISRFSTGRLSPAEALRQDWQVIAQDFSTVAAREIENAESQSAPAQRSL